MAATLGRPLRDSDLDLQTLFGRSGAVLAAEHGVDELHRLEAAVLLGALAEPGPSVVAAAAWVVEDARCREALARRAVTVVLTAPTEVVLHRIPAGGHRRPIDDRELAALAERRQPLFDEVADITIDATRSPADIASEVVAALRGRP